MKRYKVLLSLICVVVFIFLAAGSTGNDEKPAAKPEEVVVKRQAVERQDNEALEQLALSLMQDNFEGIADIEFVQEEKNFYVNPIGLEFTLEVVKAWEGDPDALKEWNALVDSFKGMSESMGKTLPGYWITLRNPVNPENSLLMVMDGIIIYNFTD